MGAANRSLAQIHRRAGVRLALAFTAATAVGCGADTAGTAIQWDMAAISTVSPEAGGHDAFTTRSGWSVELDRADVVLGPIYLHGGGVRADAMPSFLRWLGPSTAYAHPADSTFDGGPPLGDVLEQNVVNLLQREPTRLGRVFGLQGRAQTFEIQLHPPGYSTAGPSSTEMTTMNDHSFVFEGVARRGEVERRFFAAGNLGQLESERTISSIPADVLLVDESERPGPLLVEVRLDDWFRFVDFASLTEQDEQGRFVLPAGTVEGDSLRRGIRSRTAYDLHWGPQP
ncbi:MAG TPA: hypothetical protein RMG48_12650 [Myxococcales bacterium LLY-WYZ-16_1]|nr:hypothetical protein [Myxococcales bacterium LLY-WYZ-16_1]